MQVQLFQHIHRHTPCKKPGTYIQELGGDGHLIFYWQASKKGRKEAEEARDSNETKVTCPRWTTVKEDWDKYGNFLEQYENTLKSASVMHRSPHSTKRVTFRVGLQKRLQPGKLYHLNPEV